MHCLPNEAAAPLPIVHRNRCCPASGRARTDEQHDDGQEHIHERLARGQHAAAAAVAVHVADDHAAFARAARARRAVGARLQRGRHRLDARLRVGLLHGRMDLVLLVRLQGLQTV